MVHHFLAASPATDAPQLCAGSRLLARGGGTASVAHEPRRSRHSSGQGWYLHRRGALQPLRQRHRFNADVFRDLLDRHARFAVTPHVRDVITDPAELGLGTVPAFQAALPRVPDQTSASRAALPLRHPYTFAPRPLPLNRTTSIPSCARFLTKLDPTVARQETGSEREADGSIASHPSRTSWVHRFAQLLAFARAGRSRPIQPGRAMLLISG